MPRTDRVRPASRSLARPAADPTPRISAEGMLAFAAVARSGGVRSAGIMLGVPRSTISRQLAELERQLGGRLVTRDGRAVRLTDLGGVLLESCERLEALLRGAETIAAEESREPQGVLRIAASTIVGEEFLPELVAEYLRRYPKVRVEAQLSPDFIDLWNERIDVALRTGPIDDRSGELIAVRLGVSTKGYYASAAYLEAHGAPSAPDELGAHSAIVVGRSPSATWSFPTRSETKTVPLPVVLRIDSYRAARAAAIAGAGIVQLPTFFAAEALAAGALVPVLERYTPSAVLYAVHAGGRKAPAKVRAFIDLIREPIRRRLR